MATLTLKKSSSRVFAKPAKSNLDSIKPAKAAKPENSTSAIGRRYTQHLVENYPDVFNPDSPKPLKLGIRKKLFKTRPEWVTKKALDRTLCNWTKRRAYLQALAAGGHRYNLDGTPAGEISAEHQANAKRRQHPPNKQPKSMKRKGSAES